MTSREEIISKLTSPGLIPVIRTDTEADVLPICQALVAGGITALEITMTTPNALKCVKEASDRFSKSAVIGVGSVISAEMCRGAIDAGASFIVTPIMRPEVARVAKEAGRVVILGALTPTEAQEAHEAGADFVKIFPAEKPAYVKMLLGPLPHLKIIPTGGVSMQTAPDFLAAGVAALGVGSQLLSPIIMGQKNWGELTRATRQFIEVLQYARRTAKK